jgi:hypothetical protein
MVTTVNKVLYLSLLFLLLTSLEASAKKARPAPRLEIPIATRAKPRKFVRHSKPRRQAIKPRVRTTRPQPKPTTKKKLHKRLPPSVRYHNLRFLWINEVLGNTKRRTIRKKPKIRKKN